MRRTFPLSWFLLVSVCALGFGGFLLWNTARHNATRKPLFLWCAAGLKAPVEQLAREYEQRSGVSVQVQYGGSQTILAAMEISRRGDLYLPADDSYMDMAREKHLVAETIPLAGMRLVLAVRRGNPKAIRTVDDLLVKDVRIAQADPDAAAAGKAARASLLASGKWEAVQRKTAVYKLTVNDVANDIKIGAVDAGFVWDAVARQYADLETIPLPEFSNALARISVGVMASCEQPAAALRFARFLGAPEHGLKEFARQHFDPVEGDAWAETPELILYSGAVNRVAIEESIQQFEQREGARVTRIYNGCGILVAQLKAGGRPDAYLTCDASFVNPVADLFIGPHVSMSKTEIVMLVPKGNPQGVRRLADLVKPGLRVGVANADQSTLGALTRRLLQQEGILDEVMRNVATQTPTADLLVNQMRTGALDAVVVYTANTLKVRDSLDIVALSMPDAVAVQTYSVGNHSKHKHLAGRFLHALRSGESRARYERAGFRWMENK